MRKHEDCEERMAVVGAARDVFGQDPFYLVGLEALPDAGVILADGVHQQLFHSGLATA
jgi:hypothetical protein